MSSPPSDVNQYYDSVRRPPPQSAPGATPISFLSDSINRMARKSISEERSPLLFKPASRSSSHKLVDVDMVRDEIEDHKRKVFKIEFARILKMSGPVIFAYMLQNSLQTGSVLVVGRLV
jgi:MATE family multidrug resistance protein